MEKQLKISPLVEKQLLALNPLDREKLQARLNELTNTPDLVSDSRPFAPDGSGLYMRWLVDDICLIFSLDDSTFACENLIDGKTVEVYHDTVSRARLFANQTEEQKKNMILARQIDQDVKDNPQSPYAGKWVGLLGGKVATVNDTIEDVCKALERIAPEPHRGMIHEVGTYDDVTIDYIWEIN
jgi:mRNA-degrading endonuclease RelE of RelBE toxin-antitoxin system